MARFDLQQLESQPIPFLILKTNSSDSNLESAGGGQTSKLNRREGKMSEIFYDIKLVGSDEPERISKNLGQLR